MALNDGTRVKKKSLDSPEGYLGVCSTHGITCAICKRIEEFRRPFAQAHHARKWARVYGGWRYLPRWGWVCRGCRDRIPSVSQQFDAAYQSRTGRQPRKGLRRVQIEISFKPMNE